MSFSGFEQSFFDFFAELSVNNNREWFQANKTRYENRVVTPILNFIQAAQAPMAAVSNHIEAIPKRVGGSMFRIYKDVRFSKDKSPYKTHGAMQFRHEMGKDVHAPGFYVHLGVGEVFLGAGIWRPAADALKKIRCAIRDHGDQWRAITAEAAFGDRFRMAGESLKRPPKGFPADHPLIEDIKRKDFIAIHEMSVADFLKPDILDKVIDHFSLSGPLMKFLCDALGVPF